MPPGLVNQRCRIADKIGQSFLAGTERHRSGDGAGHLSHLFNRGQQPARHQRIGADCPHRGPIHAEGCHCLRTCLAGKGRAGLVMATGETLTTVDDCLACLGSPG